MLADGVTRDEADWGLLAELGVRWVSPVRTVLTLPNDRAGLAPWRQQADRHGIGLWVREVDSPPALQAARNLDADLLEGRWLAPAAAGLAREAS